MVISVQSCIRECPDASVGTSPAIILNNTRKSPYGGTIHPNEWYGAFISAKSAEPPDHIRHDSKNRV
jgi:hypothetical protein